jgi:hypothetical protein
VGGADHGPLGTYFLDAAQQELAEAACLFDLSEHRLRHFLSQSVRRFEAAVVDLFAHPVASAVHQLFRLPLLGAERVQVRHSRRYHVPRAL